MEDQKIYSANLKLKKMLDAVDRAQQKLKSFANPPASQSSRPRKRPRLDPQAEIEQAQTRLNNATVALQKAVDHSFSLSGRGTGVVQLLLPSSNTSEHSLT